MFRPSTFDMHEVVMSDDDTISDTMEDTMEDQMSDPLTEDSMDEFDIDSAMHKAYHANIDNINSEKTQQIHPNVFVYYNTLNVSCGRPESGKSFLMCRDVIQISRFSNVTHQILYISKTGMCDDHTFKTVKHLIKKPVIYLSENNAVKYLQKLQQYKHEYEKYKTAPRPVVKDEVLHFLGVNDLSKPYLHTILIFEDFVKSKLIKDKYINWLFSELRHNHCTAFINVQFFKSITTDIKNNTTSFFIYPKYSRQQMCYMFQQIATPENDELPDFNAIWERYRRMKNNEVLVVNLKSNEVKFVELQMIKG